MNKKLLLVVLTVGALGQAYATLDKSASVAVSASVKPAKKSAIDKLLEMTFDKDMILESMRTSFDTVKTKSLTASQSQASPEMDALARKFQDKITQELFSESTIKSIKALYTKVYTEQELEELVKFYESPVGQKTLKSLPEISAQVASIMTETMQKHFTEYVTQMDQLTKKAPKSVTITSAK